MAKTRTEYRRIRHKRVRKKLWGTSDVPRMSIFVSNKYLYTQFIDDDNAVTLLSASTVGKSAKNNVAEATSFGKTVVEMAGKKGIKKAIVDRGGHKFHGRVKAVVDAAVEAGLVSKSTKTAAQKAPQEKKPEGKGKSNDAKKKPAKAPESKAPEEKADNKEKK